MKMEVNRWSRQIIVGVLLIASLAVWFGWSHRPGRGVQGERLSCELPAQKVNSPHAGMQWVPGGSFELGDSVYAEEQPLQVTKVDGFWIDRTEVTNEEFGRFVKATAYVTVAEREVDAMTHPELPADMRKAGAVVFVMPEAIQGKSDITQWWRYIPGAQWRHPGGPQTSIDGRGAFPVVTVTLEDARAYAKWKGRMLPSEAQWAWAARAGQSKAGMDHEQPAQANTWQGLFPVANSGQDGFLGLAPVGCYQPNALGLFDMIGNAWELTTDAWRPNHSQPVMAEPDQMPSGMAAMGGAQRVIKGGSFLCAPNFCARYRSGSRQPQDEDLGASHLSFRTILIAPGP